MAEIYDQNMLDTLYVDIVLEEWQLCLSDLRYLKRSEVSPFTVHASFCVHWRISDCFIKKS